MESLSLGTHLTFILRLAWWVPQWWATIPHSPICAQVFRAKPLCIKRKAYLEPVHVCSTVQHKRKAIGDWGIGNSGSTGCSAGFCITLLGRHCNTLTLSYPIIIVHISSQTLPFLVQYLSQNAYPSTPIEIKVHSSIPNANVHGFEVQSTGYIQIFST